ncbi:unnamed protein product [Gongylonema pulchrum]|uniref:Uncharacterized protein n=1 Tax=Gongylonema pulchrum TaxID=637853 RepID=A0A3P7NLJ0_9BILA|nr:unnamed protein product [Gongylonema pulchrum]
MKKSKMEAMEYDFGSLKLRSRALATPWSECNRCGTSKGEKRRKIVCYLSLAPDVTYEAVSDTEISYMQMFAEVPCRSSLVPSQIRSVLWSIKDIVHVQSCYVSSLTE